jgi:hypothetical protein
MGILALAVVGLVLLVASWVKGGTSTVTWLQLWWRLRKPLAVTLILTAVCSFLSRR